jgi:hypothetical protein
MKIKNLDKRFLSAVDIFTELLQTVIAIYCDLELSSKIVSSIVGQRGKAKQITAVHLSPA